VRADIKLPATAGRTKIARQPRFRWSAPLKLALYIPIPSFLERLAVCVALVVRRLRYGYAFRRIPLPHGRYAIVDPEDFDRLNAYKWHVSGARDTYYAARSTRSPKNNRRIVVKMHREILDVGDGMFVDHINQNSLDNRKANLRPATRAQNGRNRRKMRKINCSSQYKGLTWYRREERWAVRIMANGKSKFVGYYDDEIEAAEAYDDAARKYHGQFAALNFPKSRKSA